MFAPENHQPSRTGRTVGCNERAFTLDDKPELFLSASIHYFRVPRELWADRIAKARRGGMNTVETCVAWTDSGTADDTLDGSGDLRDLDNFLAECARQDIHVIVRPGPHPSVTLGNASFSVGLGTVPAVDFQTDSRPFRDAVDRCFDAVCPIIAKHQWTAGGPVVLLQLESDFGFAATDEVETPVIENFRRFVRDGLLRRGIEVPLISCVGRPASAAQAGDAPKPPDSQTRRGAGEPPIPARSAAEIEYALWRCLADGGYNYHVYQAGAQTLLASPPLVKFGCYDGGPPLSSDSEIPFPTD